MSADGPLASSVDAPRRVDAAAPNPADDVYPSAEPRGLTGLDHAGFEPLTMRECLELMASVPVGRLAFSSSSDIVVVPVNHALDGHDIVFRTAPGLKLSAADYDRHVAFEVDHYDLATRSGWSVLVQGVAESVYDDAEIARLGTLGATPWVTTVERSFWIRIRPETISGRRTP